MTERIEDIQMRIFIERGLAVIIGIIIPDKAEITEEIDKSQGIDLQFKPNNEFILRLRFVLLPAEYWYLLPLVRYCSL